MNPQQSQVAIELAARNTRERLLAERTEAGPWTGELSSSALSTATAIAAFAFGARAIAAQRIGLEAAIERGRDWLVHNQNPDGSFGDTPESPGNLSTTALAWMALSIRSSNAEPFVSPEREQACDAAALWLEDALGVLDMEHLAQALGEVYGDDKTFAVPILFALAVSGVLGEGPEVWKHVARLPFELAALPQDWFHRLGMPVVSYALPALIAIGQAIEHHRRSTNLVARVLRSATRTRTLGVLEGLQPPNGGFLEATPLTSFVTLALLSSEQERHPVVELALDFLLNSERADGSWPIDTDLATWTTTLAIGALTAGARDGGAPTRLGEDACGAIRYWLLDQQYDEVHPYTRAAPGGWAWTDLDGGVPDADDTAGALLALHALDDRAEATHAAVRAGARWLVDLQNADGGIPTFCRGWGKLPFDKSSSDLTAHALRAWAAWDELLADDESVQTARLRAVRFLIASQREDGAWVPLWFGNQDELRQENPLYGTARVLRAAGAVPMEALDDKLLARRWERALERGLGWLLEAQALDGGFGAAADVEPSIEETALALDALCEAETVELSPAGLIDRIESAALWLDRATDKGTWFPAHPIGLYFAKLWYSERLYPLVFTLAALERALPFLAR